MPFKQCFLVANDDKGVACDKVPLDEADVFEASIRSYDLSLRVKNYPDLLRTKLTA